MKALQSVGVSLAFRRTPVSECMGVSLGCPSLICAFTFRYLELLTTGSIRLETRQQILHTIQNVLNQSDRDFYLTRKILDQREPASWKDEAIKWQEIGKLIRDGNLANNLFQTITENGQVLRLGRLYDISVMSSVQERL